MDEVSTASLLHAKLALAVSAACRAAEGEDHGGGVKVSFSRAAVLSITKLMLGFSESLSNDLHSFAAHGKRQVVNNDDVLLCARRSREFTKALEEFAAAHPPEKSTTRKKRPVSKVAKAAAGGSEEARSRTSGAKESRMSVANMSDSDGVKLSDLSDEEDDEEEDMTSTRQEAAADYDCDDDKFFS